MECTYEKKLKLGRKGLLKCMRKIFQIEKSSYEWKSYENDEQELRLEAGGMLFCTRKWYFTGQAFSHGIDFFLTCSKNV